MSFELNEVEKRIIQLENQISEKNEQLSEYRELIKDYKKSFELIEISNVVEDYLVRHPEQNEIQVICSNVKVKMKDIPSQIKNGTKIGLDYRNSIIKISIEMFSKNNK